MSSNPHRVPGLPASPRPQRLREVPHHIKGPDFKQPLASSVPRRPFKPNIPQITRRSYSSGRNISAPSIPSCSDTNCLPRDGQSTPRQDEMDVENREASPRQITPIWSRVTAVANSLTVNVSKAWTVGVPTMEGEATPPGHDSHLIRAMKAYHIANACDAADLPDWLFSEQERCIGGIRPRLAEIHSNDSDTPVAPPIQTLGNFASDSSQQYTSVLQGG